MGYTVIIWQSIRCRRWRWGEDTRKVSERGHRREGKDGRPGERWRQEERKAWEGERWIQDGRKGWKRLKMRD